jgi:hypothetical protein
LAWLSSTRPECSRNWSPPHVGERGAATSRLEERNADIDAKIDVQAHKVADLDRRLGQIDSTIEEAAKRGRTNAALSAMDGQRKARGTLVDERNREAGTLAALKAERAGVAAKGRQIETEAAPIRYVAELLGVDTDSERAIRWLIALMVLCCDPLAIALTAAGPRSADGKLGAIVSRWRPARDRARTGTTTTPKNPSRSQSRV